MSSTKKTKINKHSTRLEISRFISEIEDRRSHVLRQLSNFYSKDSLRRSICFTGPAGVGKSSLISLLAPKVSAKKRLAWLACDPSSPQSGGSLLGDRIRIAGKDLSKNLFIRSMATRGTSAFSRAIRDVEVYLESLFDAVWVETAGSGQTQSEVALISASTVLILQPETGDEIQWMKSGIRECADAFIVNKADLDGAELMAKSLIDSGAAADRVVLVSVKEQRGLDEALLMIDRLQESINWTRRREKLHLAHARDLYYEAALQKAEKEFGRQKLAWVLNPYLKLGT